MWGLVQSSTIGELCQNWSGLLALASDPHYFGWVSREHTIQISDRRLLLVSTVKTRILYNFNQFVSHTSQSPLTKRNLVSVTGHLAAWRKDCLSHLSKYGNFGYYRVSSDEISPLSQPANQVDEMKISSGVSQSHMGDELIEIVQ